MDQNRIWFSSRHRCWNFSYRPILAYSTVCMQDIVLYGKLCKIRPSGKRGRLLHSDWQTHWQTHRYTHWQRQTCTTTQVERQCHLKDIISKADDVRQFEGDICLIRDTQVIHKCLQKRQTHSVLKILYILYIHTYALKGYQCCSVGRTLISLPVTRTINRNMNSVHLTEHTHFNFHFI